jgi:hypothetical protein
VIEVRDASLLTRAALCRSQPSVSPRSVLCSAPPEYCMPWARSKDFESGMTDVLCQNASILPCRCILGIFDLGQVQPWHPGTSHMQPKRVGSTNMRLMTRMIVAIAVTMLAALVSYFVFLHVKTPASRRGAAHRSSHQVFTSFRSRKSPIFDAGQ